MDQTSTQYQIYNRFSSQPGHMCTLFPAQKCKEQYGEQPDTHMHSDRLDVSHAEKKNSKLANIKIPFWHE